MRLVKRDSFYMLGIILIHGTLVNMAQKDLKDDFVSAIYALQLYVVYLIKINKGKGELRPGTTSPGTAQLSTHSTSPSHNH